MLSKYGTGEYRISVPVPVCYSSSLSLPVSSLRLQIRNQFRQIWAKPVENYMGFRRTKSGRGSLPVTITISHSNTGSGVIGDPVAIPEPWDKSFPFAWEKAAKYLKIAADKNMPEVSVPYFT